MLAVLAIINKVFGFENFEDDLDRPVPHDVAKKSVDEVDTCTSKEKCEPPPSLKTEVLIEIGYFKDDTFINKIDPNKFKNEVCLINHSFAMILNFNG